jgi:hypothetical protein
VFLSGFYRVFPWVSFFSGFVQVPFGVFSGFGFFSGYFRFRVFFRVSGAPAGEK